MRGLEQEALEVAKSDAKFLAKVAGLSVRATSSQLQRAAPAAAKPAGLAARHLSSAPSSSTKSSRQPAAAKASQKSAPDRDSSACPDSTVLLQEDRSASAPCTHASASQQQVPQQPAGSSHQGSKAAHESPQWLLSTAAKGGVASATRAMHGPVHAESSLYAAWAQTHSGTSSPGAPRSRTAAPALTRSQPSSPAPAAAADAACPAVAGSLQAAGGGSCCAGRCASPLRQAMPVTGADAAACTAAVAAAALPGSPCGSNYHSTRAAGIAAGISRAGAVSPQHQEWHRQQHSSSRAQPPRREDTQQLWQWLADELQQLKQQLQQPQAQQQQELQRSLGQQSAGADQQQQQLGRPGDHQQRPSTYSSRQVAASSSAATALPAGNTAGNNSPGCSGRRSTSPGRRSPPRSPSPGWQQAPDGGPGLQQQAHQLSALSRGADGVLQEECVQLQLELFSAAFAEVCRQVSVGCVERGALMAQLWSAHTVLLQAAMQDRQVAQQQRAAAEQATAAAVQEQQRLAQKDEDEKVALLAINQRHAAKADAAKQECEQLKLQNDKLQELLKRLSGAQQLVQRVLDLEASHQQQAFSIQQLQFQLDAKQHQLEAASAQVIHWQGRAQAAEGTVQVQTQQLGVSTPRPRRDLGLVCDLVEPPQQQLIEQALVAGVPAAHIHRLLLGLSTTGQDLRRLREVAGSCVAALQRASDPSELHKLLRQHLADCNAAGIAKHLSNPEHLQILSQAVHVGTDTETLLSLLDGSLGLPAGQQQPAAAAAAVATGTSGSSQQQACRSLQPAASFSAPAACTPASASAAASGGGSIGAGLALLPLVGVLADKYGHTAAELGGPVTEALVQAQLSTVSRVQDLEGRCRALHKEVVMLKCTLAEQRKHEQERVEAALRDQKRKIARREARQPTLLEKFLQTKWGTLFSGIGVSEDLPRILRANTPVNNKQMPKREAERLASEIWAFKDQQDAAAATPISLDEATAVFLERRFFAIPRLVTEVAYNLIYSLGQHTYDTDCNLFLRVFSGEVDESVRHEQQLLEGEVMRMLRLLDVSINHQATGWLHKADVKTALAGFFKGKKVERLAEVLEALDTDEPGEALHYVRLFSDDDDLNQGLTAEIIRSQHLTERLEFLQEIEDYIRDAAEDNGTTTLTPAMLEACLRKAHKRLDGSAALEYVSRAFGPDWEQQKHRLTQPLGAIIRAVRCGGVPNMLRPAAGPSSSVAGAVNRIVPVGKFKGKLASALKVGFSREAAAAAAAADAAAGPAAWRVSRGHIGTGPLGPAAAAGGPAAASGAHKVAKSRRATQEAVSAAVSAVLSGDGSKRKEPAKGAQAVQLEEGQTLPAAASAGPGSGQQTGAAAAEGGLQQPVHAGDGAAAETTEGPASVSRPSTAGSRASSRSPPRLQIPADGPSEALPQLLSPAVLSAAATTPSAAAAAAAAAQVPGPQAAAAAKLKSSAAVSRALTVDVLSAMEAVRQSWLLEEEAKLVTYSSSGGTTATAVASSTGPAAPAAAATAGLSMAQQPAAPCGSAAHIQALMANSQPQGGSVYTPAAAAASAGVTAAGSAYTSSSGSGQRYVMPVVPALRLCDVVAPVAARPHTADLSAGSSSRTGGTQRSSAGSSVPDSGRGSSCCGSYQGSSAAGDGGGSEAAASSSRSLLQQRSVKPILLGDHPETPKRAKHVQISSEDTVFACFASERDPQGPEALTPGDMAGAHPLQQGQGQQELPADATGVAVRTAAVPEADGASSEHGQAAAADAAAAGTGSAGSLPDALSRSNSRHQRGSQLSGGQVAAPSPRSQGSARQPQGAAAGPDGSQQSAAAGKKRGSRGSKLAVQLPQLLLTDAEDACAAEAATPAGEQGEHRQVCFTPQAPEQGGKRNALLMRQLHKGRSLKQLEDMMLAVAGGGAELGVE